MSSSCDVCDPRDPTLLPLAQKKPKKKRESIGGAGIRVGCADSFGLCGPSPPFPCIPAGKRVCTNPDSFGIKKYQTMPKGHVWLQGDNLSNSTDSRSYGPVPVSRSVCPTWLSGLVGPARCLRLVSNTKCNGGCFAWAPRCLDAGSTATAGSVMCVPRITMTMHARPCSSMPARLPAPIVMGVLALARLDQVEVIGQSLATQRGHLCKPPLR